MTSATAITTVERATSAVVRDLPGRDVAGARITARTATGARRRTAGPPRSASGRADTVSWVADGVDENDVMAATGMSGGNCAFCNPLVVNTSPLCSAVPGAMRFTARLLPSPEPCTAQGCRHAPNRTPTDEATSVIEPHRAARRPHLDHLADKPRASHHGHADGDTARAALVELHGGSEVRRAQRGDLCGDRRDAADPRQLIEALQRPQRVTRRLRDRRLSLQCADLASQLRVLGFEVAPVHGA